jgi:hypothetical protein
VARRSALPVQVLPMLVAGICADDGARRYDDAALARADWPRPCPEALLSAAIADTVERDVDVEALRGLRDRWRSLGRGWARCATAAGSGSAGYRFPHGATGRCVAVLSDVDSARLRGGGDRAVTRVVLVWLWLMVAG